MTHIAFIAVLASANVKAQQHSLVLNAKVGDTFAYRMTAVAKVGGTESTMQTRYEMSIMSLNPKGTATFRTASKGGKLTRDGKEIAIPESLVTAKLKLNGQVVSVEPASASPLQARSNRIMQYVVAEGKVGIGQEWTWTDPASDLNGKIAAKGKGKCLEFSKRNDVPCAKLHIFIQETGVDSPASATIDVWVSLKDGMMVESHMLLKNVPFGPGLAGTSDVTVERLKN